MGTRAPVFSSVSCRHHTTNYRESKSSERADTHTARRIVAHRPVRTLSTSTALLLISECTTILPLKSIRDMPVVWSACLQRGLLCCLLLLRVLCGLVRWSFFLFFFFLHTFTFQLLDKPWLQVSSLFAPGSCLQFLSRIGFSNPTARRFFIERC